MIIPVYFQPYEDELLYSWICRLAEANEYSLFEFRKYFLEETNLVQNDSPTFIGLYWKKEKHPEFPDIKDILFRHTEYWAERMLHKEYKVSRNLYQLLYNRGDGLYDIPCERQKTHLRICPECLKEDMENGKEFYLRTWHSFGNVKTCAKHGCALYELKRFPKNKALNKGSINGEKLVPDKNSDMIANAMYKMYMDPYYVDSDLEKIFCKKKFQMTEDFRCESLEILDDYKGLYKIKCRTCGAEFFTTAHAVNACRDCPVCELVQDIPKKMLAKAPEYQLIKEIRSLNEGESIKHEICGNIRKKMSIYSLIWKGSKCYCEQYMTKKKMYKRYNLDGYEILDFWKIRSSDWVVRLMHIACGHIFETRIYKWSQLNCPLCEPLMEAKNIASKRKNYQKLFDKRLEELTGDEYVRVGKYIDASTPIEILHRDCGEMFSCAPMHFFMGQRCPCDSAIITKAQVYEYLQTFEQNFKVLKEPRKGDARYIIQFDDTGEIVKLTPRHIKQEATCLCEPTYFTRKSNGKIEIKDLRLDPRKEFEKKVKELVGDEYVLVGEYNGKTNKVNMKHSKCGHIFPVYPNNFLTGQRCPCESMPITKEMVYEYLKMFEPNFIVVKEPTRQNKRYTIQFLDTNEVVIMGQRMIKQEVTCLCEPKYFKRRKGAILPVFENPLKKEFEDKLKRLVGEEYVLISEYINSYTDVQLSHVKCGNILNVKPREFLNGQRCECEGDVTKENVYKYLNIFEQNFKVLKEPSKGEKYYTIQFNDTKEIVKLRERIIRQEATCLCEPKYFKRKNINKV